MAPPTSTRKTIRQRIATRLYPNAWPVTSVTTSDGTTTTIIDDTLFPGSIGAEFSGAWVYMASIPTDSTPIGEIARIYSVDFNAGQSTSTLIFSPALTILTKSTAEYEIHYKYHPTTIHTRIDAVLGNFQAPILIPLTLITDGDMEATGTSDWTAAGTGGTPTIAKNTSTVFHGRQSLSITNDGATTLGYAKSASVALRPTTTVIIAADVFITSGDEARLSLYASDATGGTFALVGTAAKSDASGWVHLEFVATTGSTDEYIQVWLESQAVSDVTYWDNAILLPTNQASIAIPGTIELSEEAKKLFYYNVGTGLSGSNDVTAYKLEEQPRQFWSHFKVERDETAVVPYRIGINKRPISSPLWLEGMIDFSAFAGASESAKDADTTVCPEDLVVEFVYALFLEDMAKEARTKGDFEGYRELMGEARITRNDVMNAYRGYFPVQGIVVGASRGGQL